MTSKCYSEQETQEASSTMRNGTRPYSCPRPSNSLTESLLRSHPLISALMDQSEARTLHHKINYVDPVATLSAKPLPNTPLHPALQKASCDKHIKNITHRILYPTTLYQQINQRQIVQSVMKDATKSSFNNPLKSFANDQTKSSLNDFNKSSVPQRPLSATSKAVSATSKTPTKANQILDTNAAKIAVSALTSHAFHSVKAYKSLIAAGDARTDKMHMELGLLANKLQCQPTRLHRILARKSKAARIKKEDDDNAAICNSSIPTDAFLSLVVRDRKARKLIFGEQQSRIDCVKDYMLKENVQFYDAETLIEYIIQSVPKPYIDKKTKTKHFVDDDVYLNNRRLPVCHHRTMVSHLTFVD